LVKDKNLIEKALRLAELCLENYEAVNVTNIKPGISNVLSFKKWTTRYD